MGSSFESVLKHLDEVHRHEMSCLQWEVESLRSRLASTLVVDVADNPSWASAMRDIAKDLAEFSNGPEFLNGDLHIQPRAYGDNHPIVSMADDLQLVAGSEKSPVSPRNETIPEHQVVRGGSMHSYGHVRSTSSNVAGYAHWPQDTEGSSETLTAWHVPTAPAASSSARSLGSAPSTRNSFFSPQLRRGSTARLSVAITKSLRSMQNIHSGSSSASVSLRRANTQPDPRRGPTRSRSPMESLEDRLTQIASDSAGIEALRNDDVPTERPDHDSASETPIHEEGARGERLPSNSSEIKHRETRSGSGSIKENQERGRITTTIKIDKNQEKNSLFADLVEAAAALSIVANGIIIGVQTDYMARNLTEEVPVIFLICELVFCGLFTAELLYRIHRQRLFFFRVQGWKWNVFDAALVFLQWFEVIGILVTLIDPSINEGPNSPLTNFSFVRLLRILRLLRVLRIIRILQFFGELNVVFAALVNSMSNLAGTLMLLLIMIYTISIFFTQMVFSHRLNLIRNGEFDDERLWLWWGNVLRSFITLFKSVSAGTNWENPLQPLLAVQEYILTIVFLGYVTFALLAMMNVITGIFVQSALKHAENVKDTNFVARFADLFCMLDPDSDGTITREEYYTQIETPELQESLADIGIDPKEAKILFDFIDVDGSDSIDAEELIGGLVRLKAGSKYIDNMTVLHELSLQHREFMEFSEKVEKGLLVLGVDPTAMMPSTPGFVRRDSIADLYFNNEVIRQRS